MDRNDKRQWIPQAAEQVFSEQELQAASIAEIARKAPYESVIATGFRPRNDMLPQLLTGH